MISYRPDIDGLRTVAVVPVVLYHAGLPWLGGGFVGVDVFFVISGFLITSIIAPELEAGRFSLLRFYERRARRILPALFFVLAVSSAAAAVFLLPAAFEAFAGSLLSTLGFVSNIWFWATSTGYFAHASEFMPLLHTWSLAVEEQFYIFFPLALWVTMRWGRQPTVLIIGTVVILSLGLAIWATPRMPAASFYLLPTRAWELGFGALVALGVRPRRMHRTARELLSFVALAAILVPMVLYDATTVFPGLAAVTPVLGATLLLLIGTTGPSLVHRLLSMRWMVLIGLISYSLYLWHWPVLAFFRVGMADPTLPPALATLAVALSALMATLSWRFVERPFRIRPGTDPETGRTTGLRAAAIALYSVIGTAALAVVAGIILTSNGWPARVPRAVLAIDKAAQPSIIHRDCRRRYDLTDVCRIGAESRPGDQVDLLLIGDSHAAAVAEAVNVVAREAGLTGAYIGDVSCVPLLGILAGSTSGDATCRNLTRGAVDFVRENPSLRYVVIASRWVVNVDGTYMPNEPGERGSVRVLRSDPEVPVVPETATTNAQKVAHALPHTLDALSVNGAGILLLGPVPEVGWNVPDHLVANLRWGAPMPASPDIASVSERQAQTVEILETTSKARKDTTYVPVADRICTPACPTHDATTAYYWDDDHLSPQGATRLIAPLLRPYLAKE